jgi:hypothetical protein
LLEKIKAFFFGVGLIRFEKDYTIFKVGSITDLTNVVIPRLRSKQALDKYPLLNQ